MALTKDGYVYAFGNNQWGQLGLGDENIRNIPILIPNLNNIIRLAIGNQALFLNLNGYVYVCGANDSGQLGLGNLRTILTPKVIPNFNLLS